MPTRVVVADTEPDERGSQPPQPELQGEPNERCEKLFLHQAHERTQSDDRHQADAGHQSQECYEPRHAHQHAHVPLLQSPADRVSQGCETMLSLIQ